MSIYLDLTRELNARRLRAIVCSGQAVVLHRLAILSKDGDWILREDEETFGHVLGVLAGHGARYRFGAPLDLRWMSQGWSAHFEFQHARLRIRTDFFTRPPRVSAAELEVLWREMEGREPPFVGPRLLAEMKKTNRERDYAVIGELARIMSEPRDRMLYSRSARDLIEMAREQPALLAELAGERPLLARVSAGRESLEQALDAERRELIHANERRLSAYLEAARDWAEAWPETSRAIEGMALGAAHRILVERARELLPARVEPVA